MSTGVLLQSALLLVLVVAVVILIVGQLKALQAISEAAVALRGIADDLRSEGVPLLRESRASVAAASEALNAVRVAAEALQGVGSLLNEAQSAVSASHNVVGHADETVVEARAAVGSAQRVIGQVESILARLNLAELALGMMKSKGGEAGNLAAGVGQLVKSLWHKRGESEHRDDTQSVKPETPDEHIVPDTGNAVSADAN